MIKETDNAYHSGVVRFLIYDNFYGFHSRFYIFLLLLFIGIYYNVMIPESKVRKPMQACLRECKARSNLVSKGNYIITVIANIQAGEIMNEKTVGMLSKFTGVSVHTIKYYEKLGLISSSRREQSNYRSYDVKSCTDIYECMKYRNMGFSLKDIQLLLKEGDNALAFVTS